MYKYLIIKLFYLLLKLRYDVKYQGLEKCLSRLGSDKSILVLSQYTTELDPLFIFLALEKKGIIVTPIFHFHMLFIRWIKRLWVLLGVKWVLPYHRKKYWLATEKNLRQMKEIAQNIDANRKNYLFSPNGYLQNSMFPSESDSTTSLLIKRERPTLLVTVRGMWGSAFSHSCVGIPKKPVKTLWSCFFTLLKNGIFFAPKRKVFLQFELPDEDFPFNEKSEIVNRYFNAYFLRPFDWEKYHIHLDKIGRAIVPLYFWKKTRKIYPYVGRTKEVTLETVPKEIKNIVLKKIAALAKVKVSSLQMEQNLIKDLGLNSLDITELVVFLDDKFQVYAFFELLITVKDVILYAGGKKESPVFKEKREEYMQAWQDIKNRPKPKYIPSKTIFEAMFHTFDRMKSFPATFDYAAEMSYMRIKTIIIGFIEKIKNLPNKRIGLLIRGSNYFNALAIATMMCKKTPVLLNWSLGINQLIKTCEIAQVDLILFDDMFFNRIEIPENMQKYFMSMYELRYTMELETRKESLEIARKSCQEIIKYYGLQDVKEDDTAVILFTSGTESQPKAVPLSHKNILSNEVAAAESIGLSEKDAFLGILPVFHIFGFSTSNILPLVFGCRVVFSENILDLHLAIEYIEEWKITIVCTTPTFLSSLLSLAKPEQLKSIRLFIVGAEKAPKELFDKVNNLKINAQLIEGYGITECSPILTLNKYNEPPKGAGYPLKNVEIKIVDPETKKPIPAKSRGLILAKGPSVFAGYLNDKLDPFVYIDNEKWYNTKDLGYLDEEGALYLTGRLSRTVKKGGELISFPLIEEVLYSTIKKKVTKPFYLAIFSKEISKKVRLILCSNLSLSLEEVNNYLKEAKMGNIYFLDKVIKVDPFPLFATGKIDYKKIEKILDEEDLFL